MPTSRRDPRIPVVRIVFETSLPASAIAGVRALLAPGALAAGVSGHVEEREDTGLCAGPARGGKGDWVPCWISLQCPDAGAPGFAVALRGLRGAVVEAARRGGLELLVIPAAVQWGETYHRVQDLEDVLRLPSATG